MLAGSNIFLNESFSKETNKRRRTLWPYIKCARNLNVRAYLAVDRAVIDGNTYSYNKIDCIPEKFRPCYTKTNEDTMLFSTKNCPLSNYYECTFTCDENEFSSVEQYNSYKAACFYNDVATADLILKQSDAGESKKTTRLIKGYNKAEWNKNHAVRVVKEAMVAKFSENEELEQYLKNTGTKELAEANVYDKFWGTGLSIWSKDALNKDLWIGENHTGKLLMEVRDTLV